MSVSGFCLQKDISENLAAGMFAIPVLYPRVRLTAVRLSCARLFLKQIPAKLLVRDSCRDCFTGSIADLCT